MSSEKTKKGNGELTYREKLNTTIDYLTEEKRAPFKKALKEHKFDSEVYIPQTGCSGELYRRYTGTESQSKIYAVG